MTRDIDITDGGSLRFYELQTSGITDQSKISISAPYGVTDYTLSLPATRTDNAYLKHSTAGGLSWDTDSIGFNWKNIISYGAERDGDSTDGIELAIAAAVATNGDGTVFVPEGTFHLEDTVDSLSTGQTIRFVGVSPEKSILKLTSSAPTDIGIDASGADLKRIEFHNLQFDCNAMGDDGLTYSHSGAMIDAEAEEFVLENCRFTGVGAVAAVTIRKATSFAIVNNCTFENIYTAATTTGVDFSSNCINITTTTSVAAQGARPPVWITNNQFLCNASAADKGAGAVAVKGDFATDAPRNLLFSGNYLFQCGSNTSTVSDLVSGALDLTNGDNTVIRDNTFQYLTGPAVKCLDSTRVQFVDNKVLGESAGWNVTQNPSIALFKQTGADAESLVVRDNIFERTDSLSGQLSATYGIEIVGDSDDFTKDITITGNRFDKTRRGVYIKYAYGDIRIEGNDFVNLWGADADDGSPVEEDAAIFLANLQGPNDATDQTNVRISNNSCDDCFGRFVNFNAVDVANKRSFWFLDNRWETKTAASVFNKSGVLTLVSSSNDRISAVRLAGNSWRGLPTTTTDFSYVNVTGVSGRFDAESVFEFGAVGDGATDDTKAITQAFSLLGGNRIVLPAGHTFLCSTLTGGDDVDDGFTITKSGTTVTGGGKIETGSSYNGAVIGIGNSSNQIENIIIDGIELQPGTADKGIGIAFDYETDYLTIRDCKIGSSAPTTGKAWFDGITRRDAFSGDFINVTGCDVQAAAYGIRIGIGNQQTLSANHINAPTCIDVEGVDTSPSELITISNNILLAETGAKVAINVEAVNNLTISSNTIKAETCIHHRGDVSHADGNYGLTIVGNSCFGVEIGILIDGTIGDFRGVSITGNTMRGIASTTDSGIYLKSCTGATVSGNSLVNCNAIAAGGYIYFVDTKVSTVSGNSCLMTGTAPPAGKQGVHLHAATATACNNNTITGNNFSLGADDEGGIGVKIGETPQYATYTTVSNNSNSTTQYPTSGGVVESTSEGVSLSLAQVADLTAIPDTSIDPRNEDPSGYVRVTAGGVNTDTGGSATSVYYVPIYLNDDA